MTNNYHPYKHKWQFFLKLLALTILISAVNTLRAENADAKNNSEQGTTNSCLEQRFENTYYLIEQTQRSQALNFISSIPLSTAYFEVISGKRPVNETFYDDKAKRLLNNNASLSSILMKSQPKYEAEYEKISFVRQQEEHPKQISFKKRNYNRKLTAIDKHPVFGSVKRSERPFLKSEIEKVISFAPEDFRAVLEVEHDEYVLFYQLYKKSYAAITFDDFKFQNIGLANNYTLIKFEIFKEVENNLKEVEINHLTNLLCNTEQAFRNQLPGPKSLSWFGYSEYNQLANQLLLSRPFFQKYPLVFKIGQAITLSFIGFLLLALLLGRYKKSDHSRKITKTTL